MRNVVAISGLLLTVCGGCDEPQSSSQGARAPVVVASSEPSASVAPSASAKAAVAEARGPLSRFTLSPDAKYLATSWTGKSEFAVWKLPTLKLLGYVEHQSYRKDQVVFVFSPKVDHLAVFDSFSAGAETLGLRLWSLDPWREVKLPELPLSSQIGVRFTPDGKHLIASDVYNQAVVLEVATGKQVLRDDFTNQGAPNRPVHIDLSEDGRWSVVSDPLGPTQVWDLQTRRRRPLAGISSQGATAKFISNKEFVLALGDGRVLVYDTAGNKRRQLSKKTGTAADLDGPHFDVAVDGDNLVLSRFDCETRVVSLSQAKPPRTAAKAVPCKETWACECFPTLSPNGKLVVNANGKVLQRVDVATGATTRLLELDSPNSAAVSWLPDGRHVVVSTSVARGKSLDTRDVVYDLSAGVKQVELPSTAGPPPLQHARLWLEGGHLTLHRGKQRLRVNLTPNPQASASADEAFGSLLE